MSDASNIQLKDSSKITAFKLISQPSRKGKIFLGSLETDFFIIVDSYWEPFVEIMKNTEISVEKIAKLMGETNVSKIKLMLLGMAQAKLIHKIDSHVLYSHLKKKDNYIDMLFLKISFFLTNPVFTISIFVLALIFFAVLSDINHIPKAQDFFWNNYSSLNLLSAFLFTWVTVFEHELAHLVVAKIYGIQGKLRLSHRLNFLVIETDFPNLYSVPKTGRVAIFISGIIVDMATTGLIYLLYLNSRNPILKQFILLEWLAILWQFFFYMKTDIYFIVKEIVGIENLYTYSKLKLVSFLKRKKFQVSLTNRDNRIVTVYSVILLLGTAIGLFRYGFYHLPILFNLVASSLLEVLNGLTNHNNILVIDGVIVIAVEAISLLLLGFTYLRKRF